MTTTTVRTKGVDDAGLDALADDQIAELMTGAPELFSEPQGEGPVIAAEQVSPEPAMLAATDGKVVLRNIKHVNETIFIPINGKVYSKSKVQFTDGTAVVTREQADFVLAHLPHVREEPSEGPVWTFEQTGFSTRNQDIYEQYVRDYFENRQG